jgi:hypothetical protein
MIQSIVLPFYGWEDVTTPMSSSGSVIDGRRQENNVLKLATIKSGPRCLNDGMAKDIAQDIVQYADGWAKYADADTVEFTYASLYGTEVRSNKKDWHILRHISEMVGNKYVIHPPYQSWECSYQVRNIRVSVNVRLGLEWWEYLGGKWTLLEVIVALIRACVNPSVEQKTDHSYCIIDLPEIISTDVVPDDYNISLLQHSQIEWLFFLAAHFVDQLLPG